MSNTIMYRNEAEKYLVKNGEKLFLDMIIRNKVIVLEKEIKTLFRSNDYFDLRGTISLELWPEGLVLWVGGEIRWKEWENDTGSTSIAL